MINPLAILPQLQRGLFQRKQFFSLFLVAMLLGGCQLTEPKAFLGDMNSVHLRLGNPSHVATLNPDRYHLFLRPQYALLYDRTTNTPAWASWQLNAAWLGTGSRPVFTPEPELPAGWFTVTPRNYTGSGFDRGHIVPAADRNHTPEDEAAVFYMSNIAPQAPDNNRGPWEKLESYCRILVKSGKELYIIAGPIGKGGVGSAGPATAISANKITVPAAFWKIVVVTNRPEQGLDSITKKTRVIAVLIPNQQGIKEDRWQKFSTTVQDLEQRTGYDFLSNLPQDVKNSLETKAP